MRLPSGTAYICSLSLLCLSGVFCEEPIIYWDKLPYAADGTVQGGGTDITLLPISNSIQFPKDPETAMIIGAADDMENLAGIQPYQTDAEVRLLETNWFDENSVQQTGTDGIGFRWKKAEAGPMPQDLSKGVIFRHTFTLAAAGVGGAPAVAIDQMTAKSYEYGGRRYLGLDRIHHQNADPTFDTNHVDFANTVLFIKEILKVMKTTHVYLAITDLTAAANMKIAQQLTGQAVYVRCLNPDFEVKGFSLNGDKPIHMMRYIPDSNNVVQPVLQATLAPPKEQAAILGANNQLDKDLAVEKKRADDLDAQLTQAKSDLSKKQQEVTDRDSTIQGLNNTLTTVNQEKKSTEDKLDQMDKEKKKQSDRADAAETDAKNWKAKAQQAQPQNVKDLEAEKDKLKAKVDDIEPKYNAALQEIKNKDAAFDTAINKYNGNEKQTLQENYELSLKNKELEQQLAKKQSSEAPEGDKPKAGGDNTSPKPEDNTGGKPTGNPDKTPPPRDNGKSLAGYNLGLIKDIQNKVGDAENNQLTKIGFRVEYEAPLNEAVVKLLETTPMLHIQISPQDSAVLIIIAHMQGVKTMVLKKKDGPTEPKKKRRLSSRRLVANSKYSEVDNRGTTFDTAAKSMIVIIAAACDNAPKSIVRDLRTNFKEDLEVSSATTFAVGSGYTWLVGAVAVLVTLVL